MNADAKQPDFTAVWQRVFGIAEAEKTVAPGETGPPLTAYWQQAWQAAGLYQALAARCGGSARRSLSLFADKKRSQCRRLAAAHCLLGPLGQAPSPPAVLPRPAALLPALGQRCRQELASAQALESASAQQAESLLQDLLAQLALEDRAIAARLLSLLEESMTPQGRP